MRDGQRLVGVELHAHRPGEAATFYAWLLGPASGVHPDDWSPVSMLFQHAVCGIHPVTDAGPPASWVPVVAVAGVPDACDRARAEGWRVVEHRGRWYTVDGHGIWTRLVAVDRLPPDVDPDALGNTTAEVNCPDSGATAASYGRVLQLRDIEMLDDPTGYHMLLDGDVLALGALNYETVARRPVGTHWVVYFDVPHLDLTMRRLQGVGVGVEVAVPVTKEDYNIHTVLVDPFGVPFGLCSFFHIEQSLMRVRPEDGEETLFRDAVRLLVDPRDRPADDRAPGGRGP